MPDAGFLEKYSLYRKFSITVGSTIANLKKPRINMHCQICNETRTFGMTNEHYLSPSEFNKDTSEYVTNPVYKCVSCQSFERNFSVRISSKKDSMMKIGQYPAWDITPDSNIELMLKDHKSLLKKGLISESQGYGIGAFSYYRRIVEEIIDDMLDSIEDLLSDSEKVAYRQAIAAAKTTRQTSEKIALVQDLMPSILRPQGANPLALLHRVLSEGLHAESDEKCLDLAVETREILIFFASQIAVSSKASQVFTERMRSLLDKRDKK